MNHLKITQEELARLCNVSQGTVDRALNGRKDINEATRKRILDTAKKYGYRTDKGNSKVHPLKTLGVILFDLNNQFFSRLITDIEETAKEKGFTTLIMFTHYDQGEEIKCIRKMYSSGVDAIILASVNGDSQFSTYISQLDIPVIQILNQTTENSYVGIDDFLAMKQATEYLQKSYNHIVYFSPALSYDNAYAQKRRYEGFLSVAKNYTVVTRYEDIKPVYSPDTAVLCSADHYALYVYTVNKDVKIMGFDNLSLIDKLKLPIDSVDSNTREIARNALYLAESKEKRNVIVEHRIVTRG